jgi:hypothetical protein
MLGEALSAREVVPVPTVSHVWVNPSSRQRKRIWSCSSVGSVVMSGFNQWDTIMK